MENGTATRNPYLLIGGSLSLAFALFQLSAIFWSQELVKYYGGPASMQAEKPIMYAFACVVVAALVAACGLYAFSGAGKIRRLPFLRTVLITVTTIYTLRGLALIRDLGIIRNHPELELQRFAVYSAIALGIGIVHLLGVVRLYRQAHAAPHVEEAEIEDKARVGGQE